jgi:hypothetical protein
MAKKKTKKKTAKRTTRRAAAKVDRVAHLLKHGIVADAGVLSATQKKGLSRLTDAEFRTMVRAMKKVGKFEGVARSEFL